MTCHNHQNMMNCISLEAFGGIAMDNKPLEEKAAGIIARAKTILLNPEPEWNVISAERNAVMKTFINYAVPLAAIGPVAALIGGLVFGYGGFGFTFRPTFMGALSTAITSYVLSLASLWVLAWIANFLSPKFGGKEDWPAAFNLAAFGMTAAWVSGIFGIFPPLSILGILGLYSLYLIYKGAPVMLSVAADKAVAFTAVLVVIGIVLSFIVGAITAAIAGPGAMLGGVAGIPENDDVVTATIPGMGEVTVDGDSNVIDMGDLGRIEMSEDGGTATMVIDGQEITIDVPEDEQ